MISLEETNIYLVDIQAFIANKSHKTEEKKLLSRCLLSKILSLQLGTRFENPQFFTNEFGKPFLATGEKHFNISYSKDFIALAIDNQPIGIDIEYVKELTDIDTIVNHFSKEEKEALLSLDDEKKIEQLYNLWVLKESYLKAIGKGLSCPLNSFSITLAQNKVHLNNEPEQEINWQFKTYSSLEGYKCAVCAGHSELPENPILTTAEEILSS